MPVIVVANPKGGVGKSTLSSNIAGYFARQGHKVMLGDIDRQQSSRLWLQLRPDTLPAVQSWDLDRDDIVRPPKGTTHVVLDTPAGLHGKRLQAVMKLADHIIVPLQASVFDIYATQDFLSELHRHKRSEKVKLGVVANRVKDHTKAAEHLQAFLRSLEIPWLAHCMVSSAPANYAMQCSSARPTPPSSATTTAPGATSKLPVHDPVVTH